MSIIGENYRVNTKLRSLTPTPPSGNFGVRGPGSAFQAYSLDCITIYITGSANHLLIKFPENWFPENCKNLKLILKSRPREGRGLKSAAGPAHSKVL